MVGPWLFALKLKKGQGCRRGGFWTPSFSFEHFDHVYLFRGERISLGRNGWKAEPSDLTCGLPDEGHFRTDERRRIARELHNGTSQLLALMQLTFGRLKRGAGGDATLLVEECEKAIQEIRDHIRDIYRD